MEATVAQMKVDAFTAEANLQKLTKAGTGKWTTLSGALAESHAAFARANPAAWDAFKTR